jgi:hypothetical protein
MPRAPLASLKPRGGASAAESARLGLLRQLALRLGADFVGRTRSGRLVAQRRGIVIAAGATVKEVMAALRARLRHPGEH